MNKTTDAVKILHKRYIGDDPVRLKSLEDARIVDKEETWIEGWMKGWAREGKPGR